MPRVTIQLSNPLPAPFYGTIVSTGKKQTFNSGMIATQIAGLVPVDNAQDCRPQDCFCVKVFSTDRSSFLFESLAAVSFRLEQYVPGGGGSGVDLSRPRGFREVGAFCIQNTTTYPPYTGEPPRGSSADWLDLGPITQGTEYAWGSFADQPYYSGFEVDWAQVLADYGEGTYRFAVGNAGDPQSIHSLCFELKTFSCEAADQTVYVEAWLDATVGDVMNQEKEFFLKGINWKDACRYPGRLGGQTPEYEDTSYMLAQGKVVSEQRLHRSRSVIRYDLKLYGLPLELILRLFHYGLVKAQVTDYNYISPSRKYKALKVVRSGSPDIDYSNEKVTNLITSATLPLRHQFDNNLLTSY
jgi:hypothetical protein